MNEQKTDQVAFLQKKHAARKILASKGVLKRAGVNNFDHYTYFTEAQYKHLFTQIFTDVGLEFHVTKQAVTAFEVGEKNAQGRRIELDIKLTDIDTGYTETAHFTGEGFDRSDKALYKAYTGCIKSYFATNFLVPTGDEPEKPQQERETPKGTVTPKQLEILTTEIPATTLKRALTAYKKTIPDQLTMQEASAIITKHARRNK